MTLPTEVSFREPQREPGPGHQPSLGTDRFSAVRPAHARQHRSSTYVLRFVY
jgi:hypothetical protein